MPLFRRDLWVCVLFSCRKAVRFRTDRGYRLLIDSVLRISRFLFFQDDMNVKHTIDVVLVRVALV